MVSRKISNLTILLISGLLLVAAGCASEGPATYKVVTDARQSVRWTGTVPKDPAFREGSNITKTEIVFTQETENIDAEGNTTAKVTIESLKYSSEIKGRTILDFDSSRETDVESAMAKLIGQSYTIRIAPGEQGAKVVDASGIRSLVKGTAATNRAASRLLSDKSIEERHSSLVLPDVCGRDMKAGKNWKNTRNFEFGVLGSKSYERTYEVKDIKGGTADVEMKAIPTSELAEALHKEQQRIDISEMFDSTGEYKGRLEMDLNNCEVASYSEALDVEWIIAQPLSEKEENADLVVLVMSAKRDFDIRKIK